MTLRARIAFTILSNLTTVAAFLLSFLLVRHASGPVYLDLMPCV